MTGLAPGFADPVHDAQAAFRGVLDALSTPARIVTLAAPPAVPAPLMPATVALCLTLVDYETPLWLDGPAAAADGFLRFHCGCPIAASPADARFAVVTDPLAMPGLHEFAPGEDLYPDRSATLLVQVAGFGEGRALRLTGPGIRGSAELRVAGLPDGFAAAWADNATLYPLGVDVVLVAGDRVVGLPRTVRMEG
ncbi:MAG: phosphonate C-P lyase system protein PhnH [Rhodospirillales bacterium]|jgi:alpha-D-ribose 1-methylphosphonate 5-triphosphate synthase subunit PhnH